MPTVADRHGHTGLGAAEFARHIEEFGRWQIEVANHRQAGVDATLIDLGLCEQFLREKQLAMLDGPALLQFITWLRRDRENCPATANRKISSVKTYMRFLRFKQVEGASAVPVRELPRINVPWRGPVQTLSPEEVRRLLDGVDRSSAHGCRDFVMYSLMYRLGLRVGEVHALDLDDIDFDELLITVHGKGGKERILPLVSDLPDILREWFAVRSAFYRTRHNDALFISQKGNRIAIRTIEENFHKLVQRTGPFTIERVTPHTLRHAFVTHAVEENPGCLNTDSHRSRQTRQPNSPAPLASRSTIPPAHEWTSDQKTPSLNTIHNPIFNKREDTTANDTYL